MDLTKRSEDIIRILLSFADDHPVSTTLISEKLGISTRSVQREMIYVEKWLTEQGYSIRRKRGSGISICESNEKKKHLLSVLDRNPENEQLLYDRDRRQRQIKYELLLNQDPVKIYYLTDKYDVSEGTLFNDLNQITPWFHKYNLSLIRRTGLGVFIQGEELALRRALTSIICEIIESDNALDQHNRKSIHNYLKFISSFDPDVTYTVNQILSECENKYNMTFSDSGYIALVVYMVVMIYKIKAGKTIIVDDLMQEKIMIQPEYGLAQYLADYLHNYTDLIISKDEICGIAMQLSSTRIIPNSKMDLTKKSDLDIHQIVVSIIKKVSELTLIDFTADANLVNDLSIHIQPTIGRLRSGIPIDNPLLANLKEDYPDIYDACEKACPEVLKEELQILHVPASEIGFITMHFGAAMERHEKKERKIRVIIVCPTGIGSSRLLAADLKLEYPFLDIRGTMSAFDIDQRKLLQAGIDLIISTIKLETSFRYVHVNTIPTKHDKALLNNRIEYLLRQKKTDAVPLAVPLNTIKRSDVGYISLLGDTIYEILENLCIHSAPILHNREELIRYAAVSCSPAPEFVEDIYEILKERDELDDTYIKPFHALLLHGRSDIITSPTFQYIRLEPPFYESGKVILGAVVSLIPKSGIRYKVSAAITSQLIGNLLDNHQLLAAMRSDNTGLLRDLVEYDLLDFYKNHVAEVLGITIE